MPTACTDQRFLCYLDRALTLELSAVQRYSTQANLARQWGLEEPAERLRGEALEEMQHVERIIARMLSLGAAPNASQVRPSKLGPDLLSLLRTDQECEMELIQLYLDASRHGDRVGADDDRRFFQDLLEEEQAHARDLAQWIAQVEGPADSSRAVALGH
jgi:bacterioferritin